jgi:hypothetical protein
MSEAPCGSFLILQNKIKNSHCERVGERGNPIVGWYKQWDCFTPSNGVRNDEMLNGVVDGIVSFTQPA